MREVLLLNQNGNPFWFNKSTSLILKDLKDNILI